MKETIVLGLSGGVDSSAAALLLRKDYAVLGVYLDGGHAPGEAARAEEAARGLGISFCSLDMGRALEEEVCRPFAESYLAGRTPIPCALCNPRVKFPALLEVARQAGATKIATGHYAGRATGVDERALLLKGRAPNDQSYLLSRLTQDILAHTVFPLAEYNKPQIRALAAEHGLAAAHRADSMEICFIPEGDHAAWLDRRQNATKEGNFVDKQGNVLGRHRGYYHYTLGQGRGLGVSGPHRYYVSAIRPERNEVVLSDGSDLWADTVFCTQPNYISLPDLVAPVEATVRLRHSRDELPGEVVPTREGVTVHLHKKGRAPTPGQLCVFYQGEVVLGSAWIDSAE